MTPTLHMDLFGGIGGMSLAAHWAGFTTVAHCEIEPYPRAVLAKHWPDVPIFEDVRHVTAESIRAAGIGHIDLLTAGVPCQPPSQAGRRKGSADNAGCGLSFCDWCGNFGPCGCWQRTLSESLAWSLTAWTGFCQSWKRRVISAKRMLLALEMSARPTEETGCSSWPTPDTMNGRDGLCRLPAAKGNHAVSLHHKIAEVCLPPRAWATPSAADAVGSHGGGQVRSLRTDMAELKEASARPTPRAGKVTDENESAWRARQERGDVATPPLSLAVKMWPTPTAEQGVHPGRVTIKEGQQVHLAALAAWKTPTTQDAHNCGAESRGECLAPSECAGRRQFESGLGRDVDEFPSDLDGCAGLPEAEREGQEALWANTEERLPSLTDCARFVSGPEEAQKDWEPPRLARGVKNQIARLKALGNAVDPVQVYPILSAIRELDWTHEETPL